MDKQSEILLQRFLIAATKRSQYLAQGDPKRANREYDKMHALKPELRKLPDSGEAVLRKILETERDSYVRVDAAYESMQRHIYW
jgi:hypothetical protein